MEGELTILIVDDERANRDLLQLRLSRRGYAPESVPDGEACLERIAAGGVALVLLDWQMPAMSGIDVLKTIRKTHSPSELPVIMVTAESESAARVDALDLGANDYVTKPVDIAVLLARISAQLRIRRPPTGTALAPASDAAPAGTSTALACGTILADRYRIDRPIGSGSFGTVYRAVHTGLDRPVAVKILDTKSRTPESVERFRREGISACRLRHENAVEVLDCGVTSQGIAYLVMELLEGEPLEELIRREAPLPPARCEEIIRPVCDLLTAAHEAGIVHRDIKPANIFLHRAQHGTIVKVLDFGIAKIMGEGAARLTTEGASLGTPLYMAPELATGSAVDGAADVYALGIVLYEMLTARHPFDIDQSTSTFAVVWQHAQSDPIPPRRRLPTLSEAVERVVLRALARKPAERLTARELAQELTAAVVFDG